MDISTTNPPQPQKRSSGFKRILLVIVIAIITTVTTVYLLNLYLFPKAFKPVKLTHSEEQALEAKIQRLEKNAVNYPTETRSSIGNRSKPPLRRPVREAANAGGPSTPLAPEPYRENSEKRKIRFTEREINALLAHNTDLADKLAIDLSENLASARLLIPLDPDFPILGGKTLRVSAGLKIRFNGQEPVIKLRGVSLWGVPLPNAWLGGIKDVNLVNEMGGNQGFWNTFSAGVKAIRIQEGSIFIELKQ